MIKIVYPGNIAILKQAAQKANDLLGNQAFYDAIAQKTGFYFSKATGAQVAGSLQQCNPTLTVKTFKKLFTRELGYEAPNDPTSIHINVAGDKLRRSLGSIAGTFIHEAVHAADADDEALDFHHKGNKSAGNHDTAPYWIGNLAVQMIDHPHQAPDTEHIAVVAHAPEDTLAPKDELLNGTTNFTLSVTVKNGEQPPTDINVTLDGPSYHQFYVRPSSFSKSESLQSGAYDLTVSGSNPDGGETVITLSGDFDGEPDPSRQETRDSKEYSMNFSFIIA